MDVKKQRFWRAELENQRQPKTIYIVMRTQKPEIELKNLERPRTGIAGDYEMYPWCGNVSGLENRKADLKTT